MESILNSTKQVLGIDVNYNAFDLDIMTHINATFSTLSQLGVGSAQGFYITGSNDDWVELQLPDDQLHLVKSYVYLKVKSLFDPPQTSYHMNAMKEQIKEFEWRLNMMREVVTPAPEPEEAVDE